MSHDYYITPDEYAQAAEIGIHAIALEIRVRSLGWKKRRALEEPLRKKVSRKSWGKIAAKNGIAYSTFIIRITRQRWTPERAATEPLRDKAGAAVLAAKAREHWRRFPAEIIALAKQNGIPYTTFYSRANQGWDLVEAATVKSMTHSEAGLLGKAGLSGKRL
jgi:hypothetical protein